MSQRRYRAVKGYYDPEIGDFVQRGSLARTSDQTRRKDLLRQGLIEPIPDRRDRGGAPVNQNRGNAPRNKRRK